MNDHSRTSSVTSMLERLKLPLLQNRRQYSNLVMFQKIVFNHVDLNINEYIHKHEAPSARTRMATRSTKTNQFVIPQSNTQPHLYSFFPNMARSWNSIPEEITSIENVNKFLSALQKHICSWYEQPWLSQSRSEWCSTRAFQSIISRSRSRSS